MTDKFLLRWVVIIFIFIIYYAAQFFFGLMFSLTYSFTMSMGDFTESQCIGFARELLSDYDNAAIASLIGFSVGVPLILLAFKKIR